VVRSTSEWFSAWLDEALEAYRRPSGEGSTPRYSVVVGKSYQDPRSGTRGHGLHILYRGTAAVVRTRDLRTLGRALLSDLGAAGFAERRDAIYLAGGAIMTPHAAAIVPSYFISRLARLRRRAEMAGVVLPGTMTVALDHKASRLLPLPSLETPPNVLDRLVGPDDAPDARAFVDQPVRVGALLSLGPSAVGGLSSASRSIALYRWGTRVVNLGVLGGPAVESLAQLVTQVPCLQVGWQDPVSWLGPLGELLSYTREAHEEDLDEARRSYATRGSGNTRPRR
jgi:hypothetical protein